eukprot:TRINITY_DN70046_c0_g1_i1.p1 TRINITY_DN70046_c0_g1~~TRINITY_DN70046_c0_g1_i1.p1  ORF type:complete len:375 (+),score=42.48 TRINITY_DN70046_c0_g1_i1:89-1213(+)
MIQTMPLQARPNPTVTMVPRHSAGRGGSHVLGGCPQNFQSPNVSACLAPQRGGTFGSSYGGGRSPCVVGSIPPSAHFVPTQMPSYAHADRAVPRPSQAFGAVPSACKGAVLQRPVATFGTLPRQTIPTLPMQSLPQRSAVAAVSPSGLGVSSPLSASPYASAFSQAPSSPMTGISMSAPSPGSARTSGVILCIGDSLTAGRGGTTDSYPAALGSQLEKVGYQFVMQNAGVYGNETDVILQRLPAAIANAKNFGPIAFVFVLGGTNDLLHLRSSDIILERLRHLHDAIAASASSAHVGVLTVPKCGLFELPVQEEWRQAVNAGLKEMCQQRSPRFFLVDLDDVGVELAGDGVHYYGEGYKEFGRKAFEAMSSLWN